MILGIKVISTSIRDLYELLELEGLPKLVDDHLQVFSISDAELSGLVHVFSALPEEYMWVTSLSSFIYSRQHPKSAEVELKIEEGSYEIATKAIYRRSGITQKRSIRGLLHPKMDPFSNKAKHALPMGAGLCATFLNALDADRFFSALNSAISDLKEFLIFPLPTNPSPDSGRWLYMLQEDWARHGDGSSRDRSNALRYANDEMRKLLQHPRDQVASLYHQLDQNVLFNYCSMAISWGGDTGIKALENDLLWERAYLQAQLINALGWPIFYPYVSEHIDSQGDWFQNLERWAAIAPSAGTNAEEVIELMRNYLRNCELSYASLRSP